MKTKNENRKYVSTIKMENKKEPNISNAWPSANDMYQQLKCTKCVAFCSVIGLQV